MNAAHWHLMINHIPVMGVIFGMIFLLVAMIGRNKTLIKASLWILVVVALATIPVFLSGDPAMEMIKNLPGVSHDLIHEHEELAEKAFIAVLGLGVIAALGLLVHRTKNRVSGIFLATVFVLTIITGVLMAGTANMGGEIRHPEIRSDPVLPFTGESTAPVETPDDD
jgi:uncharacterized membrane protein